MLQRWSWKAIIALGIVLLVPAVLNVTYGNSLAVWWAPFPMWIFFLAGLRVPLAASAFIPSAVFIAMAVGLLAGRRGFVIASLWLVGAASVIHVSWMIYLWREGVERYGLAHTGAVFGLGTIVLTVSVWFAAVGRRRHDRRNLVLSVWLAMLWWGWWAMPWLGEGV